VSRPQESPEAPDRRELGRRAEAAAEKELRRRGYRIVERNVRTAGGELDLVALEGGTLCFVEVRARTCHSAGTPLESVNWKKRRQLTKLARSYMRRRGLNGRPARFDVVAVAPAAGNSFEVTVVPDAFQAEGPYAR